jgi:hypothetical protein
LEYDPGHLIHICNTTVGVLRISDNSHAHAEGILRPQASLECEQQLDVVQEKLYIGKMDREQWLE